MLINRDVVSTIKQFKHECKKVNSPIRKQIELDYNNRQMTDLLDMYFTVVTAQSYGPTMEKLYIRENGYTKVPAKEDRGDYRKPNDDYEEYKFTFPNGENKHQYNFVQIRPWQDLAAYVFEVCSDDHGWFRFRIPKKSMEDILLDHASLAHGTIETNKNEKKELALRGRIGDSLWQKLLEYKED